MHDMTSLLRLGRDVRREKYSEPTLVLVASSTDKLSTKVTSKINELPADLIGELDFHRSKDIGKYYPETERDLIGRSLNSLRNDKELFLMFHGTQCIAYAMITHKSMGKVKLSPIWVRENHRRLGVGQLILSQIDRIYPRVSMYFTVPEENTAMRLLAEKCGYCSMYEFDALYRKGHREILYSKLISQLYAVGETEFSDFQACGTLPTLRKRGGAQRLKLRHPALPSLFTSAGPSFDFSRPVYCLEQQNVFNQSTHTGFFDEVVELGTMVLAVRKPVA